MRLVICVAALFAISILVKLILLTGVDYVSYTGAALAQQKEALQAKGFDSYLIGQNDVLIAQNAECNLYLYMSRPEGGDETIRDKQFGAFGKLVFWFDGALYQSRPTVEPLFKRNVSRLMSVFGRPFELHPVFGIFAGDRCTQAQLDGLGLRDL
ncbi:hypothetical protein [Rhizobium sp. BE258]|uniref:hypothetical protein n=1 Tax=Rhizobium sp. BE258 TaxID=2817722 RepID=UPI002867A316|nr:hypothetical protein [Rhizobium sp. BE258]MDR7145216.1 hypothetical protein [Rhizobium sp. BE258]